MTRNTKPTREKPTPTNQDPQPCHVCEARPHDTICDVCGEVVCEKCLVETIGGITVCIECQEQVQIESVTKEEP